MAEILPVLAVSERPDLANSKAVVLVTDGGDEAVESQTMGGAPLYIVGVINTAYTELASFAIRVGLRARRRYHWHWNYLSAWRWP